MADYDPDLDAPAPMPAPAPRPARASRTRSVEEIMASSRARRSAAAPSSAPAAAGLSQDEIREVFEHFDDDNSSSLTIDEVARALIKSFKATSKSGPHCP